MKSIERHTAEIKKERLAQKHEKRSGIGLSAYSADPMNIKTRFSTEMTNLTGLSGMDGYANMARMQGAGRNAVYPAGGWRVTARPPERPYQPILKDVYPRNAYTMMPEYNAPKYYSGHFVKYDFKDVPQQPSGDHNEGRPVVFKKQDIQTVQTKKKYGGNPKGQSSVPLHLCNDTDSLLYQRSLQPSTLDDLYLPKAVPKTPSSTLSYPYALHKHVKNEQSALHPLKYTDPTQTWVNTKYPTDSRNRGQLSTATSGSSSSFRVPDRSVPRANAGLTSGGTSRSAPEWFSEFFPRQKVADTMKFMGTAKQSIQANKSREYDVNFNGKR